MSRDGLDSPRPDEKDCWLRHWGSGCPRDSVGRFGSSVGRFGSVGLLARWAEASWDLGSGQWQEFSEAARKNAPRDGRVR